MACMSPVGLANFRVVGMWVGSGVVSLADPVLSVVPDKGWNSVSIHVVLGACVIDLIVASFLGSPAKAGRWPGNQVNLIVLTGGLCSNVYHMGCTLISLCCIPLQNQLCTECMT